MRARNLLVNATLCVSLASCRTTIPRAATEADIVFTGTPIVLQSATFDVDDASNLAVVRVERVLQGLSRFPVLSGSDVTVELRTPAEARVGQERVYYAELLQLGEHIAVRELASTVAPSPDDLERVETLINRTRQEQEADTLRRRLATAEQVIRARVVDIGSASRPEATEHDPRWQEASLLVVTAYKGPAVAGETVTILFPGSADVAWRRWPRPTLGAEAIWLLRPYEHIGRRLPRLTVQPGDSLGLEQESRVRQLLR